MNSGQIGPKWPLLTWFRIIWVIPRWSHSFCPFWVVIYFFQIMLWLIYGINCPNIVLFGPQKIKSLGLSSHFPFCLKFDFSLFPMLISPLKQGWNEKIRTLLLTKLFEVKEWKCHYFWDSVIFWCWILSPKTQLCGFSDQWAMTWITWDQVRGGHFGPI